MKAIAAIALCLFVGINVANSGRVNQRQKFVYKSRGETVVGIPLSQTRGQATRIDQDIHITRMSQRTFILKCRNIVLNGLRNDLSDAGGSSTSSSSESSSQSSSSEEKTQSIPDRIRQILESPIEIVVSNQKVSSFRVEGGTPRWARNIFRGLITQFHFFFEQMGDLSVGGATPQNEFQIERQESIFGKCPTKYQQYNLGPITTSNDQVARKLADVLKNVDLDQSSESQSSSSSESSSDESANSSSGSSSSEELQDRLPRMAKDFDRKAVDKFCDQGDHFMVVVKVLNLTACQDVAALDMGHPALEMNNTNPLYQRQVVILNFGCGMGPGDFKTLGVVGADTLNVGFSQSELPSMKQVTTQRAQLTEIKEATNVQALEKPKEYRSIQYEYTNQRATPKGNVEGRSGSNSASDSASDSQSNSSSDSESNSSSNSDSNSSSDEEENEEYANGDLERSGISALILDPKNRSSAEYISILKDLIRKVSNMFRESGPNVDPIDVHKVMDKYRTVIKIIRILPKKDLVKIYSALVVEGKSTNNRGLYTLYFNALLIAGSQPSLATVDQLFQNNNIDAVQKFHYLLSFPQYVRRPSKELIRMFKATAERVQSQDAAKILKSTALLSLASITYQACVNKRVAEAKYPVELNGHFCTPSFARSEIFEFFAKRLWSETMAKGNDEQKAVLITAVSLLGLPESVQLFENVIQSRVHSTFIRTKAVFGYRRLINSENGNEAVSKNFVKKTVLPNLLKHVTSLEHFMPSTVQMAAGSLIFVSEHSEINQWSQVAMASIRARDPQVKNFVHTAVHSISKMDNAVSRNHKRMQKIAVELMSKNEVSQEWTKEHKIASVNLFTADEISQEAELEFYGRFALMKSFTPNDFLHMYTKGSFHLGPHALAVTPLNLQLSIQGKSWTRSHLYAQLSAWNSIFVSSELNANTISTVLKNTELGRILSVWMSERDNNAVRGRVEHFNVQKAFQPVEIMREVPTIMGYPVVFRMSTPIIFSTNGRVGVKGQAGNTRVQADVYLTLAAQFKCRLAAKIPHSMQSIVVAYEKNLAIELPFRVVVQKGTLGELMVALTPTQLDTRGEPQGQITLVSVDQKPYTAVIQDPLAKSLNDKYASFSPIRTQHKSVQTSVQFGQSLGMKCTYEEERDFPAKNSHKYGAVLYRNQNLTLNVGESKTNTFVFVVAAGKVSNLNQETQQDNNSGSSSESNESKNQSRNKNEQRATGTQIEGGYYLAVLCAGKKTFIQTLEQTVTNVKDITGQNQGNGKQQTKNTFQYLIEAAVDEKDQSDYWIRASSGNAANKAAKNLAKVHGYQAVKNAILEAENSDNEPSICIELDHESKGQGEQNSASSSEEQKQNSGSGEQDWTAKYRTHIRYGKTCQPEDLHEVQIKTLIDAAKNQVDAVVNVKGGDKAAAPLKEAMKHLQMAYHRQRANKSQKHQHNSRSTSSSSEETSRNFPRVQVRSSNDREGQHHLRFIWEQQQQ